MNLPGYDAWKTETPEDKEARHNARRRRLRASLFQCDACGEMKENCRTVTAYGMDCTACPACLGEEWRYED